MDSKAILRTDVGIDSDQNELEELQRELTAEQAAHAETRDRLESLFQYAPESIVMLDVETGRFLDVNPQAEALFGRSRDELLDIGPFELSPSFQPYGSTLEFGRQKIAEAMNGQTPVFEWWHCNRQGAGFPCEVRLVKVRWGDREVVRGTIVDISERKRLEICDRGRGEVLERLARSEPLTNVLNGLALAIGHVLPGMICSILLLDREQQRLRLGVAPGMSAVYNRAVDGISIGPEVGSCGAAAYRGERVIVSDVSTHPNWAPFRELTSRMEFRACWSEPILSLKGGVLGTFAMYYRQPREPMPIELRVIETAAELASIAIEHAQTQRVMSEMNKTLRLRVAEATQELVRSNQKLQDAQEDLRLAAVSFETNDSIVITDPRGKILRVNRSFSEQTDSHLRK